MGRPEEPVDTVHGAIPNDQAVLDDLPPRYSLTPSGSAGPSRQQQSYLNAPPQIPILPYHKYRVPGATLSSDGKILTIKDPKYATDPKALAKLLLEQASLPPKPLIHVKGWHQSSYGPPDFEIRMNMTGMIYKSGGDPLNYVKTKPPQGMENPTSSRRSKAPLPKDVTLEQWTERFCNDPSSVKRICVTRQVVNWDTEYVAGALRNMISSSQVMYQGNLEITFPIQHSTVIYQVGEPTILKSIKNFFASWTTPGTPSDTVTYDVVESVWPYANISAEETGNGSVAREFAVAGEAAWWQIWKPAWRNAILERRKGTIGIEDWVEASMGMMVAAKTRPWGVITSP